MTENMPLPPVQSEAKDQVTPVKEKLPVLAHLMCGWPFILVAIGGCIGGAMGGAAYAINVAIYKSKLPVFVKVPLNILTGLLAIVLWAIIAAGISTKFKK
jgi:hypothetical protein